METFYVNGEEEKELLRIAKNILKREGFEIILKKIKKRRLNKKWQFYKKNN